MTTLEINPDTLKQVLQERFGYEYFREGQQEIIASLLGGRDTLVIKSTGGGKSLCYQLPSLLLQGITVVVCPLISLMEDQVQEARKVGRKDVVAIHSGLSSVERKLILTHLTQYRLLYISPEGLRNEWLLSFLKKRGVSLFVVDEAHCISWWGHDFRMDYLRLAAVRESLGRPICLALTATATPEVREDIIKYLHLHNPALFQFSMDRRNIALQVEQVYSEREKQEKIIQFVKHRNDAGMIYFSSRAKAEEMTQFLIEQGEKRVAYYHGGMSAEERQLIQQQFSADELRIICATNAFGMGINKPNIRYVIHYHFSHHIEGYVQEMGRCSRDGQPGLSYVFFQDGDEQIPYRFIEQELPDETQLQLLKDYISAKCEQEESGTLEEIGMVLGVSEQAMQFILFHLERLQAVHYSSSTEIIFTNVEAGVVLDRLRERVEAQRTRRLKKVANMNSWLRLGAGQCRRKYLLHYFSENLTTPVSPCCDLCGLEEGYLLQDIDNLDTLKQDGNHQADWRSSLKTLWPIN